MGKHSKVEQKGRFRKIFAGAVLGVGTLAVGAAAFLSGHGSTETAPEVTPWAAPGSSSSTSTDAALPNVINVFGQDAVSTSFNFDPIQNDFNIMLIRESQEEMRDQRKAYLDFMKQFDDLKKQFHAVGGKSPASIDKIVEQVNQRVSSQFKDHPGKIDDFKSLMEMLDKHEGSSQDIAALDEQVMQYIGLSDNRMLVVRTNSQGDAGKGADVDVLVVNDAPEGVLPHFVAAQGHVNELLSTDKHPGQLAFIDARNQRGAFFTVTIPKAG
jgi:hypothetical protein